MRGLDNTHVCDRMPQKNSYIPGVGREKRAGAERVHVLCRLSSELLGEVFAAVEPGKPKLTLTPELLELHQVQSRLHHFLNHLQ